MIYSIAFTLALNEEGKQLGHLFKGPVEATRHPVSDDYYTLTITTPDGAPLDANTLAHEAWRSACNAIADALSA